jgi:hypothetical protein
MPMRTGLLVLLGLAPIWPALAQQRPLDIPTRSVTATYRLEGGPPGAGPQTMTMWYDREGDKMRIGQDNQGYTVMDGATRRTYVVNIPQHSYFEVPFDPAQRNFVPPGMRFTKDGTKTVAGLTCTEWVANVQGHASSACITADGVMLSAEQQGPGGQTQRIVATSVSYGPQPASLFQPPTGYQRVQPPPMPGPGGPGAPGQP